MGQEHFFTVFFYYATRQPKTSEANDEIKTKMRECIF
jgi:hypothetical protein